MKIDGGCHCGAITYEAEVDPEKTSICHCTDCQQSDYRITRGTPKVYIKTGSSGAKRAQGFCGDCGSHLYATSAGDGPKIYGIRVGTARQRQELIPKRQVWHRSVLHWLPEFEGMTTIEGQ